MPIVRIDIQSGKTTAYKRDILHGVRAAIVEALGVADDRIMQRIVESPADDIDAPDIRTDRLTIIEISMLPGRGVDLKESLYNAIVRKLGETPGIYSHDIMVLVNEPTAECFALGGVMQCTLTGEAEEDAEL
jgi:4-oxalocrotonate tautomerase